MEEGLFIDPPVRRVERAVMCQEACRRFVNWPACHVEEQKKLGTIDEEKLAGLVVID